MKKLFILLFMAAAAVSCVSNRTFNSMKAECLRLEAELASVNARMDELLSNNDRLTQRNENLSSELELLKSDYSALKERYDRLSADGSAESSRMLKQIEESQRELRNRSQRVEELEQLLKSREEAMASLRRKVADALTGFEGKGLSISTRDGKVYVSMDDKLLFRSGSFDIDPAGARAVRDLSGVLADNPDIAIMVEGHTDDVPYKGSGNLKDNLDLSVKRATTVVRLILENGNIAPSRIVAAGRGEYQPVAEGKSPEARALNRRTEIILSPKLDELMKIMDR